MTTPSTLRRALIRYLAGLALAEFRAPQPVTLATWKETP